LGQQKAKGLAKGEELYKDKLIPAMTEGAEAVGKNPDDVDRMIEMKISYDTDPGRALENTRFWSPLSLTAEQKNSRGRDRSVSVLDDDGWVVPPSWPDKLKDQRPAVVTGQSSIIAPPKPAKAPAI
jgi:alkanesulfonate monooxygenase SsuD/methylene tetrahydromethanopterin reductase-like flavin-dependent oxidoreductase (luciferase family)